MKIYNGQENSCEQNNFENSDKTYNDYVQDLEHPNIETDNVILLIAKMSEDDDTLCNSEESKDATVTTDTNNPDPVQSLSFGGKIRNRLGLKLLIEATDKADSEVDGPEGQGVWNPDGAEDSSPCSPLSASSGSSTASGDDSGFSSDENRSNEKTYKLARTKSLRSALKSPTHVGKQKTVRFADSLGLDLVQKTYFESDDVLDHEFISPLTLTQNQERFQKVSCLKSMNIGNRSEGEISHLARTKCVCLSSISITDTNLSGIIHVLNLACDKQVCVRYTTDSWASFSETRAIFTRSVGSDGAVDSFSFFIALPNDIPIGATCEFCIRYSVNDTSYWDNNCGENYKLQCVGETREKRITEVAQKFNYVRNSSDKKNEYGGRRKSFLVCDEDEDEDYYYYTPSYNLSSVKKGYFEQRFGCSYGDHLHFY
ncbi:unnamed protein product [Enterobius vermicularis]|uniref:CBM21 domain-containing protein n=1 Tax=Enterobius vermicularis TaxID=51028 RepID=A0A0N4VC34_ENTVE|nr:unnamed protein product [Enterobius vermicularis]